ncbi:MAG: HEAT repeat domain-containing protein [Actinomycetota bacterium]
MGKALFYFLSAMVAALALVSIYLMVRILRIYRRARTLETMRGYETILYAALPRVSPEEVLRDLLPDPQPQALEEVLLRMMGQAGGHLREKVERLYELAGFTDKRIRELGSRSAARRAEAARRLGTVGVLQAEPLLRRLLDDADGEVREAAQRALESMGSGPRDRVGGFEQKDA